MSTASDEDIAFAVVNTHIAQKHAIVAQFFYAIYCNVGKRRAHRGEMRAFVAAHAEMVFSLLDMYLLVLLPILKALAQEINQGQLMVEKKGNRKVLFTLAFMLTKLGGGGETE